MQTEELREPTLFDWLHSINTSKTVLMNESNMKKFDPFMIRRGLGMSIDNLDLVEKMQRNLSTLPNDVQYAYLLAAVVKKKRYDNWPKKTKDDDSIEVIMKYYNVSRKRAREYRRLLDADQIKELENRMFTGGKA